MPRACARSSRTSSTRPRPRLKQDDDREVQPTLGFQRVLQRAVFHVQSSGKKEVSVANVLVAIFSEKHSHAAYLLGLQEISRLDVVNFISHGLSKSEDAPRARLRTQAGADRGASATRKAPRRSRSSRPT